MKDLLWQIEGMSFEWPDRDPLLHSLFLEIKSGDRILLRGANGSGKTTLMRLLTGALKPSSGKVLYRATAACGKPPESWRGVFFCGQNPRDNLFGLIPRHDLEVWRMAAPDRFPTQVDPPCQDQLIQKIDQPYSTLSQGELKAASLLWLPLFLDWFWLLDEPTDGLDTDRKQRFVELCGQKQQSERGFLIVSHDPDLPGSLFSRVLSLDGGRLREDT